MTEARVICHWTTEALVIVDGTRVRIKDTPSRIRWRCDACGEGPEDYCPHTRAAGEALDAHEPEEDPMPKPDVRDIPDDLLRGKNRRRLLRWLEVRGWRPTLMELEDERARRDEADEQGQGR